VKRVQDVITTFCKIRQVIPAKLLLVGDGPERMAMEELSRKICAPEDVRFLGKIEQVEEVLSVSDLFLMTSEKESFGLAALEAMACEVPVVSTRAGGLPELNIDGESGFLCDVGDVEDMVKKSLHILDKENHEQFRRAALKRAKMFDIRNVLPHYEEYYQKIINKTYAAVQG
jgi:N-acetyl-alpha-D-glucosaminyl L-malate synthase BshA